MAPLFIIIYANDSLNTIKSLAKFLIDNCSKQFERAAVLDLRLLSDKLKCSQFSRDYIRLQSEVESVQPGCSRGIDWPSVLNSVKSLIISDVGPICFVNVVIIQSLGSYSDELPALSFDFEGAAHSMIKLTKIAVVDSQWEPEKTMLGDWNLVTFPPPNNQNVVDCIIQLFRPPIPSQLSFGNLNCAVSLMPALQPHIIGCRIDVEGFVSAADCFGPAVMSKHVVFAETSSGSDTSGTLCALLHASLMALKQEETPLNLVALVSLHTKDSNAKVLRGFISTYADVAKKKSNLVLRIFPPDQEPAWLGSVDEMLPAAVFDESNSVPRLEKGSFPVADGCSKTCSYNDSGCIAWLHGGNLFADAQKFVRLAKKVTPEKRGQVFTEADRIIAIAAALSFPQYLTTIANLIGKEMELNQSGVSFPILSELQHKFETASHATTSS